MVTNQPPASPAVLPRPRQHRQNIDANDTKWSLSGHMFLMHVGSLGAAVHVQAEDVADTMKICLSQR